MVRSYEDIIGVSPGQGVCGAFGGPFSHPQNYSGAQCLGFGPHLGFFLQGASQPHDTSQLLWVGSHRDPTLNSLPCPLARLGPHGALRWSRPSSLLGCSPGPTSGICR